MSRGSPGPRQPPQGFVEIEAAFQGAVHELDEKIEELRSTAATDSGVGPGSGVDRAEEQRQRMKAAHRAIREDIEGMHARLGSGIGRAELDRIGELLAELEKIANAGRDSHDLLPRARYAIARRLNSEAGELAIKRIMALLKRAQIEWPDPTHYRPTATPEEIERSRRRRLAESRENFLAQGFERTAGRMLGIVRAWGGDYPDRGSPLWEETVLEGVAAGIRGQLLSDFVELLRADWDVILNRTEGTIGKQVASLHQVVESGIHSVEQARFAMASALRSLDEGLPEVAWEHIRSKLPQARGEFPGSGTSVRGEGETVAEPTI